MSCAEQSTINTMSQMASLLKTRPLLHKSCQVIWIMRSLSNWSTVNFKICHPWAWCDLNDLTAHPWQNHGRSVLVPPTDFDVNDCFGLILKLCPFQHGRDVQLTSFLTLLIIELGKNAKFYLILPIIWKIDYNRAGSDDWNGGWVFT